MSNNGSTWIAGEMLDGTEERMGRDAAQAASPPRVQQVGLDRSTIIEGATARPFQTALGLLLSGGVL